MSLRFHKTAPLITLYHNPTSPTSLRALALLRRAQRSGEIDVPSSGAAASSSESPGQEFLREASSSAHGLEVELEIKERAKEPPTPGQVQTILEYLRQGAQGVGAAAGGEEEPVLGLRLGLGLGKGKGRQTQTPTSQTPQEAAGGAPARRTPAAAASSDPSRLSRGEMRTRVRAYQSSNSSPGSGSSAGPSNPSQLQPEPELPAEEIAVEPQPQSQWPQLDDSSLVSRLKDSELLVVDWDSGRAVTDLAGVERLVAQLREEQQQRVDREKGTGVGGGGCMVM